METAIWIEVAVAVCLAAMLGYFFNKLLGCFMLAVLTALALGLCVFAARRWEWGGLLAAMLLVGALGSRLGYMLSKRRGASWVAFLWFWFCTIFLLIYGHADWVPLLTIALPSFTLFWGGLFVLSGYILPPQEGIPNRHRKAFRSLLTFTLGTNYPYYVIQDWKKEPLAPRVEGDVSGHFFAGPGIVITSCDHLVTTFNGIKFREVRPPGLSFTEQYDRIYAVVDLRPQLRAFEVKAETKDGIPVKVLTFVPFRIHAGERQPQLGASYPFDERAVFRAVYEQPIDHQWRRDEQKRAIEELDKVHWDDLVSIIAPPIVRSVIVEYTCDELCAPGDPRVEIKKKIVTRLKEALEPLGIQMLGGGIGNIMPADEVIKQRIENWKAEWKRKIEIELGKGEAEMARQLDSVRTQAQIGAIKYLAHFLSDKAVSEKAIALRLIEALEEMTCEKAVRQKLPEETREMDVILEKLRDNLQGQKR